MARERCTSPLLLRATRTRNTVEFYLRRGAQIAAEPDAHLLALEPEDNQMELALG